MNIEKQILLKLQLIEADMKAAGLWRSHPPKPEAFESTEPFSLDTMSAEEWLQWVLIPRMRAMIEQNANLPTAFDIIPYFEEVYKEEAERYLPLLEHLRELDSLFTQDI
ncbi:YqcC family protein [Xenorhabdus bovienii]|uniref:YqcC family protein n=1 Tax=Xenorhabdus bovienii TaxID=40576 RepID=UPI0023B2A6AD|nr:YqcC family protein [Xenorhabdus bovienii]MDE9494941.1 YqcC family protein [Xenorhabdus bovienii]MDE9503368.1 YqcC family protein [Xenorhabdus bovienii]MDE9527083.1 YqcC family protein [Xenorhabdus bovienii]MDE9568205.1 YqcC family protein [Xenorhabdus bovienii]